MDQNEQKSVWLKLILPICLGLFAAAIYHNAIKTQKVKVDIWVADKSVDAHTEITSENWEQFFTEKTIFLHKQTDEKLKPFVPPAGWVNLRPTKNINKDEYVYPFHFDS